MTVEEKAKELLKTFLLIADNKVSQMEFQLCIADAKQFLNSVTEKLQKLEKQNKALGERVLQLQKDKGKLIDENRELKAQNEKLRCCGNCKKYDGGCCKFVNCKYQYVEENREIYNEDHWEPAE